MAVKTKEETPETKGGEVTRVEEPKGGELANYAGYAEDIGAGFEGQTAEDISVPFIEILQSNSPETLVEDGPRAGTIINRTTGEIWKGSEGIAFIPATTSHVVVEWVPREKGGGIVATHALDSELVRNVRSTQPLGKYVHPENGNDLVETFYVYGIFVEGDQSHPAVMAFSSTRIKPYKDWMFRARSIIISLQDGRKLTKLPLFSHRYRLTTVAAENNHGKWHTLQVRFDGTNAEAARIAPSSELYAMAKALCADVNEGRKVADTASMSNRDDVADRSPQRGSTEKEDAPY